MRGKKYFGLAIIMSATLALFGCGEAFPELTEDEYNQTVEFAVGLLMKYSNNGQAKLTYVDAKEVQKERDKEAKEAEKEAESQAQTAPSTPSYPQQEYTAMTPEDELTGDLAESTDISESGASDYSAEGEDETTTESSQDPNAIILSADQSQEIMDNIFLSYQGYSVSSTYPESSKSYVVNADKGKKLLVLRFDLYNAADSSQQVNMLNLNLLFQIILNGNNLGYSSVTFLPNDLSSYIGNVESKAHESLVILTQIDEKNASKIETLGLIVTQNGLEQSIILQ